MWDAEDFEQASFLAGEALAELKTKVPKKFAPDTQDVLSKEFIHAGRVKGVPPSNAKSLLTVQMIDDMSQKLSEGISEDVISGSLLSKTIAELKIGEMECRLPSLVAKPFEEADLALEQSVEDLVRTDLMEQTRQMAYSGLDIEEIMEANEAFVDAILRPIVLQRGLGTRTYIRAKQSSFHKIVTLEFTTTPTGANVKLGGQGIGDTTFEKKFYSGRIYTFSFSLAKHKPATKAYFVPPFPDTQPVHEDLFSE